MRAFSLSVIAFHILHVQCDDQQVVEDDVGLLQVEQTTQTLSTLMLSRASSPLSAASRPWIWLHLPKTGSGVMNTFLQLPSLCTADVGFANLPEAKDPPAKQMAYTEAYCAGSFEWWLGGNPRTLHPTAMGSAMLYNRLYVGHTFSMFRQPEQRTISHYYEYIEGEFFVLAEQVFNGWTKEPTLAEFAHRTQGWSVRMITRIGANCEWMVGNVTEAETALAVSRVSDGHTFSFIGITDQWDLSMCLVHAMFGGKCLASDFANTRPGPNASADLYDTAGLLGWVDVADGQVYAEALKAFQENLNVYGVSMASCSACFADARTDSPSQSIQSM